MNPRVTELFLDLLARRERGETGDRRRVYRFAIHEPEFARLWVTHAIGSDAGLKECLTALVMLASEWDDAETLALLSDLAAWWRPEGEIPDVNPGLEVELSERLARLPETLRSQVEGIAAGLQRLEEVSPVTHDLAGSPAKIAVSGLSGRLLDALQSRAAPSLKAATVEHGQLQKAIRDSSDAFLPVPTRDPVVATVERVMARSVNVSLGQAEPLVVLRYQPGQQYRWHRDYRSPDQPGGPGEIKQFGQRVHTGILYLNGDYQGGETEFRDWQLQIRGEPGQILSFPSVDERGRIDPSSIHRGAPPTKGEKWIATLWFREYKLWHRRGLL